MMVDSAHIGYQIRELLLCLIPTRYLHMTLQFLFYPRGFPCICVIYSQMVAVIKNQKQESPNFLMHRNGVALLHIG